MPMATRSRGSAAATVEASSSTTRPVKKKPVKSTKTAEKVDHGAESAEDDVPLATLKKKPAVPAKAAGKTKAADKKILVAKAPVSGENEPKISDETLVIPAKTSSKTKAGPKKPVKIPASAVSQSMEETFVVNQDKVSVEEEGSPVTKPRIPKKKAESKPFQEESSETEDEIPPKADAGSKKVKPIVIPLKPRKHFQELDVAPELQEVAALTGNERNDLTVTDERDDLTVTDEREDRSEDEPMVSDEEYETPPPRNKLQAAAESKKAKVNKVFPELASEENAQEIAPTNPPKRGRKKELPQVELAQPENPVKPAKRGALEKETQSNIGEVTEALESNAVARKQPKKLVKKAAIRKERSQSADGLSKLLKDLEINEAISKKGKQKKAGTTAKSKAKGKKTAKTIEVDSKPETNITKYSSTESLKNVTMTRGVGRSVSEDNLHSLGQESPIKPRLGALKLTSSESESDEEPAKKKAAPRKKTGK